MEYKFALHSAVKLREYPPGTGVIEDIHILGGVRVYAVRLSGESKLSYFTDRELRVKPDVQTVYAPGVSAHTLAITSTAAAKVTCEQPVDMERTTSTLVGPVASTSTASAQILQTSNATVSNSVMPTATRVLRSSMQKNGKSSRGKHNVAGYKAKHKECNSNDQNRGMKRTKRVANVADAAKSSRKNAKQASPDVADGPYEASQGQVGTSGVRSNQQPNRNATHTTPPNSDNNSQHANLFDVPLIDATMGPSVKLPKKRRSN